MTAELEGTRYSGGVRIAWVMYQQGLLCSHLALACVADPPVPCRRYIKTCRDRSGVGSQSSYPFAFISFAVATLSW